MSRIACRLIEPLGDGTYRDPDTGRVRPIHCAPVGSMWFADWFLQDSPGDAGPDGRFLVVMTPAGTWCIDRRAGDGTAWQRTGVAPRVTATPSILLGKNEDGSWAYHAWLRDGVLEEIS